MGNIAKFTISVAAGDYDSLARLAQLCDFLGVPGESQWKTPGMTSVEVTFSEDQIDWDVLRRS